MKRKSTRSLLSLSLSLPLAFLSLGPSTVNALWPIPRQLSTGNTTVRLSNSFEISTEFDSPPSDLQDAIARAASFLKSDALAPLVPDRGASLSSSLSQAQSLQGLVLSLSGADGDSVASIFDESVKALEDRDEGYTLAVPSDGSNATLVANTTLGLFRGLTTFGQLFYTVGEDVFATQTPVQIEDSPAFPYRGMMLDTARNFFPISDIKRTLDAMSWVKLNQFHWHIVDSQSFPLLLTAFPQLANSAAYSPSSIYTEQDVSDIIQYAGERGIDVLLEIDTPGHTSAISKAFPEHIACAEATPWASYAAEPPAGQLRLTSESTRNFTAELLSNAALLTKSKMFSTGGDEVNAQCYAEDEQTQKALNETGLTIEDALDGFVNYTHRALIDMGKTPVVWEEMVLDHNITLDPSTIVMVWISSDDVRAVAEKGFNLVHAASDYFYLDCGAGGWVGDFVDGNSWCDPFKTWQKTYSFDPYANLTSDSDSDSDSDSTSTSLTTLVKGGESLLWTEQSGPENLDSIVWPRAASGAEVFWTGETMPDGLPRLSSSSSSSSSGDDDTSTDTTETTDSVYGAGPNGNSTLGALARLHDVSYRFRNRGVRTISLQPEWCARRPGVCDLTA